MLQVRYTNFIANCRLKRYVGWLMDSKLREPLRELAECSLPKALETMGERWSFLILRAAFNGLRHFEEFQSELGIARNILANRLARLVGNEILDRRALPCDRRKIEYRLTDKGRALLPTMVALRQWGERWETGVPATPVLVDERDRLPVRQVAVLAHDGRELTTHDLVWLMTDQVDAADRPAAADLPATARRA